jgi:hypothetical protein
MGRNVKPVTLGIIGVAIILLLIGAGLSCTHVPEAPEQTPSEISKPGQISEMEKEKIQEWIKENDLNKYGDPQNTLYAGGTPLYNEGTGETIDLYEYILSNHPERPWLK